MSWKTMVIWVMITLVAAPLVVFLVPQYLGFDAYVLGSGSMNPTLKDGDVVYVEKVNPLVLEKGDVIVFQPNQSRIPAERVVHRIVDVNSTLYEERFITKGDANSQRDPGYTPGYRVLGRVVLSVPYLGKYVRLIESAPLILLLVFVPAVLLVRREILALLERR